MNSSMEVCYLSRVDHKIVLIYILILDHISTFMIASHECKQWKMEISYNFMLFYFNYNINIYLKVVMVFFVKFN